LLEVSRLHKMGRKEIVTYLVTLFINEALLTTHSLVAKVNKKLNM